MTSPQQRPPQVGVALTPEQDAYLTKISQAVGITRTETARHLLERGIETYRHPENEQTGQVMLGADDVAFAHLQGIFGLLRQVAIVHPGEAAKIAYNLSEALAVDAKDRAAEAGLTMSAVRKAARRG